MTTMRRVTVCVAQLLLLLSLGGCLRPCSALVRGPGVPFAPFDGEDVFDKIEFTCETASSSKRKRFSDRYYAVRGRAGAQDAAALGRLPVELWGPFRVEVTVRTLGDSADGAVRKARAGLEVDARGSSPLEWWAVRTQRKESGATAWATSHDGTVLGSADFPDSIRIVLAIDYDGTKLRLLAREVLLTTQTEFVELASIDYVQTLPMNPGLSIAALDADVAVAFDDADVVRNGEPPVPRDAEHQAFHDLAEAAEAVMDAVRAVDGIFPGDPANAAEPLDRAAAELAAVRAHLEPLVGKKKPSPERRALSALRKADRAVSRAASVLEKKGTDGIGRALKQLFKSLSGIGGAGIEIVPLDLVVPLPSHEL